MTDDDIRILVIGIPVLCLLVLIAIYTIGSFFVLLDIRREIQKWDSRP